MICRAFPVVAQDYRTSVTEEYVLQGNFAVVKCTIPSFVADFVSVTGWQEETSGVNYFHSEDYGNKIAIVFLLGKIYIKFLF